MKKLENMLEIDIEELKISNNFALKNINLNFLKGNSYVIIGENGSGKTTLLNSLACINKDISYNIYYENQQINLKNVEKYYPKISFVNAHFRNMYMNLSARSNLQFYGGLYGISNKILNERIAKYSKVFHLEEHLNKLVSDFSNGMLQRLHFVRSLLHNPDIIFLDEPTNGLDIVQSRLLYSELNTIAKKEQKIVVYISHELVEITKFIDEVIIMEQGKVIMYRETQNILSVLKDKISYIDISNMEKIGKIDKDKNSYYIEEIDDQRMVRMYFIGEIFLSDSQKEFVIGKGKLKSVSLKEVYFFRHYLDQEKMYEI